MYFLIVVIILILWTQIEQRLLIIKKYFIASTKLGREFSGTSMVVLSDLHNHTFGRNNRRLLSKIDQLSPDFILVAGDMINKEQGYIPSNGYLLLQNLAKKYKVYYALGNHEQRAIWDKNEYPDKENNTEKVNSTWVEFVRCLEKSGVIFLDNKSIILPGKKNSIRILGVSIDQEFYAKGKTKVMPNGYLQQLLGSESSDAYQILLAHNPLYYKEYAEWGADLIISGHIHGGLVRLPFLGGLLSPQVRFFPKYHSGRYTRYGKEMIVSRGLGSHSIMFRLFNPPELVYIKLKK